MQPTLYRLCLLLCLFFGLIGCNASQETATPETPTSTVTAASIPVPTATRLPTVTITPRPETATPTEPASITVDTFTCRLVSSISMNECEALIGIFFATRGTGWGNQYPNLGERWLTSDDPCEWHGVICTNGEVVELDLRESQLRGTLTSDIADLTNMKRLIMYKNELGGPLPEELGEMDWLLSADLSNNQLRGSIPESIGGMTALEALNLNFNQLDGFLPVSLSDLIRDGRLGWLDVSNNRNLIGPIPEVFEQLRYFNYVKTELGQPLPDTETPERESTEGSSGGADGKEDGTESAEIGSAITAKATLVLTIEPTPTPAATNLPPTDEPTIVPTSKPTATNTSPAPTATALPTPTATPEPSGSNESLQIVSLDATIEYLTDGSEDVTITWETTGASSVTIWTGYSAFILGVNKEVGASGTETLRWNDESLLYGSFGVIASDGDEEVTLTYNLRFSCPDDYFFNVDVTIANHGVPVTCPSPYEPLRTTLAGFQPFENGRMLYFASAPYFSPYNPLILVLFNDGTFSYKENTWSEGEPPSDPLIVPPDGRFQPEYGFGEVWRENPQIRERLGWATAQEIDYTASIQSGSPVSQSATTAVYISLPNQSQLLTIYDGQRNNSNEGWRIFSR